jgi:eukaryotic-like serine/threonine-protein kinase
MSSTGSEDLWSSEDDGSWSALDDLPVQVYGEDHREGDLVGGKYRLLHKLGEGAMGAVWAATNTTLAVNVAVKLMRREIRSADLATYLLREARAAAALGHAAVVRIFDLGETADGDPFLVMELIEGESLRRSVEREGRMAPERAVALLLPIAGAMQAAHERGVVHRDLKPDNIMLVRREGGRVQPKVIDFGVAKILREKQTHGSVGFEVFGTPDYMPPEQALALASVDHRADIWSFCAMLYELLAGRPPFSSRNALDGMRATLQDSVPSLVERCGLDAALWATVERGLQKEPDARWASMRELGEALAAWLWSRGVREDVCGASLQGEWLDRGTRRLALSAAHESRRARPGFARGVRARRRVACPVRRSVERPPVHVIRTLQ